MPNLRRENRPLPVCLQLVSLYTPSRTSLNHFAWLWMLPRLLSAWLNHGRPAHCNNLTAGVHLADRGGDGRRGGRGEISKMHCSRTRVDVQDDGIHPTFHEQAQLHEHL